ncbi:MAG TPA: phospholipase D family protein, partial [Chloroflexota bacterium]|nr:phospholipase D family protein [Chloroflexota bacterium]
RLLLDALRPPVGYELDRAVGTTYTLDLISLLAAPLGFAMLDRQSPDGRVLADPMALLEAARRYADRIDIFCQKGEIGVPAGHRPLLAYLESSVHEVEPPHPNGIFHPKVWAMRYRRTVGESQRSELVYRVLCLSRNLTFDQSWDTVLSLDGTKTGQTANGDALASFVEKLPGLAFRTIEDDRAAALRELSSQLRGVKFFPPSGFDRLAFLPLGFGGDEWPFGEPLDQLAVISPFLTAGCVSQLARRSSFKTLVSRRETLDRLGAEALAVVGETLVLSPLFRSIEESEDSSSSSSDGGGQAPSLESEAGVTSVNQLRGLHAKLYVADVGRRGRVWTGSANATDAAFNCNVEFLIELEGPRELCGIEALMGSDKGQMGLQQLLKPYLPENLTPKDSTDQEELERALDRLARSVSGQAFLARVTEVNQEEYGLTLGIGPGSGATRSEALLGLDRAVVRARPLTLDDSRFLNVGPASASRELDFGVVSFASLTSFFVIELAMEHESGAKAATRFVVNADLLGAPADRRERLLVQQLANKEDLLRYLLLLLDGAGWPGLGGGVDVITGRDVGQNRPLQFDQWHALLEPLVRALGRDPASLDSIHKVIEEMKKSEDGRQMMPKGLLEIWEPIWDSRTKLGRQ